MYKVDVDAPAEVIEREFMDFMKKAFPNVTQRSVLLQNADLNTLTWHDSKFHQEMSWIPYEGVTMKFIRDSNMDQSGAGFEVKATRSVTVGNGKEVEFVYWTKQHAHLQDNELDCFVEARLDRNHVLVVVNANQESIDARGDVGIDPLVELQKDIPEIFENRSEHLQRYDKLLATLKAAVFRGTIGTTQV